MTELGDFPLQEPPEQPTRRQGSRLGPLVAVASLLGAAAAGIVCWMSAGQGEEAVPPSPVVAEIPVTPEPDAVPDQVEAEGPEKLVLPPLGRERRATTRPGERVVVSSRARRLVGHR